MKTREQALQEAADILAEELATIARLTPMQAAERAWHPGGPPVEVLAEQIRTAGLCREEQAA